MSYNGESVQLFVVSTTGVSFSMNDSPGKKVKIKDGRMFTARERACKLLAPYILLSLTSSEVIRMRQVQQLIRSSRIGFAINTEIFGPSILLDLNSNPIPKLGDIRSNTLHIQSHFQRDRSQLEA